MSPASKPPAGGRVVPFAATKTAKGRCPLCGKPASRENRPFCSRRCADLDLGHWLDGRYRIATSETPEDPGATGEDEA